MSGHYQILKVSRDASAEEIKKAHRLLTQEWRVKNNTKASAANHRSELEAIDAAFQVLSDKEARALYDLAIDANGGVEPRPASKSSSSTKKGSGAKLPMIATAAVAAVAIIGGGVMIFGGSSSSSEEHQVGYTKSAPTQVAEHASSDSVASAAASAEAESANSPESQSVWAIVQKKKEEEKAKADKAREDKEKADKAKEEDKKSKEEKAKSELLKEQQLKAAATVKPTPAPAPIAHAPAPTPVVQPPAPAPTPVAQAPVPTPAPAASANAASAATAASAQLAANDMSPRSLPGQVACPTQVVPELPKSSRSEELVDGAVRVRVTIQNGAIKNVQMLSGPRIYYASVKNAISRYRCQNTPYEVNFAQEFNFTPSKDMH